MDQISILVVDDEKEIADLVEIYLVSDGYKVFKANNALDGLAILEKEEIHLVLLDIMMPGMDGLEMCRKIRETNNIPIIMLSAKSTDLEAPESCEHLCSKCTKYAKDWAPTADRLWNAGHTPAADKPRHI